MNNISLTVPLEVAALNRASKMLADLANDCGQPIAATVEIAADPIKQPAGKIVEKTVAAETPQHSEVVILTPEQTQQALTPAATSDIATYENPDIEKPDKTGLRWDYRIHAKSKLIVKRTGEWKLIRNTAPELIAQVRAEQAAVTVPTVTPVPTSEGIAYEIGAGGQAVQVTAADQVFGKPQEVAPANPVLQPVAPITPTPTAPAPIEFAGLMAKIAARQVERPAFGEAITAALTRHGIASLPLLFSYPDKVVLIDQELDALWLA